MCTLPNARLPAGTQVGPYEVLSYLGGGGHGAVYRVRQGEQLFALKLIRIDASARGLDRVRFDERARQEIEALRQLDSPFLLRVHGFGWWEQGEHAAPYLVMELVDGLPLREWMAETQPSWRRLLDLFIHIGVTISQLHTHGLCHRDLNVGNLLVKRSGQPVVAHLGVAQGRAAVALTVADLVSGRCEHVSPEFADFYLNGWRRGERYGHQVASDFHALGALLYEAITGSTPFRVEPGDVQGLVRRALQGTPNNPGLLNPRAPPALCNLVQRMLAKRPWERPRTGEELSYALLRVLGEADGSWDLPVSVSPSLVRRAQSRT